MKRDDLAKLSSDIVELRLAALEAAMYLDQWTGTMGLDDDSTDRAAMRRQESVVKRARKAAKAFEGW